MYKGTDDSKRIEIHIEDDPGKWVPTNQEEDEKDFEETWDKDLKFLESEYATAKFWFLESRRTLREKIKADPTICKLEVEEWPESPDYLEKRRRKMDEKVREIIKWRKLHPEICKSGGYEFLVAIRNIDSLLSLLSDKENGIVILEKEVARLQEVFQVLNESDSEKEKEIGELKSRNERLLDRLRFLSLGSHI